MQTNGVHHERNGLLFPENDTRLSLPEQPRLPLRRQDTPPAGPKTHWVERLAAGQRGRFIVYSPALWGVWTHWTKDGTKPCYEDHAFCHTGHKDATLRWYGYIFGWSYQEEKNVFTQLTDGCCKKLLEQLAPKAPLRGLCLDVWCTPKKKGRMLCKINDNITRDPNKLPPDQDPELSLLKLWKVTPAEQRMRHSLVSSPEEIPGEGDLV